MTPPARTWIDWLRPAARRLPRVVRAPLSRWMARQVAAPAPMQEEGRYAARLAAETAIFADQVEVHDLPPIFHYWSNRWLRPQLERFGFSNPDQFFARTLQAACVDAAAEGHMPRFASVGCGNCDTEVRVAQWLVEAGVREFVIDCVDINADMLARGRVLAEEAGVTRHIHASQGDFNAWRPRHAYDAVLANQSLHHVENLEGLFTSIDAALTPNGRFVTSDMIGRNGHMRWPEALAMVHEYWAELPQAYRRNVQLRRHEAMYENWDCSGEGFEGVRAQDILPLLVDRFDFELFIGYGNLIDPFVDRGFGPHFDADARWDREFIDRVHARDESEMLAGRISPTHMMAVLRKRPYAGACAHLPGLDVAHCLRAPDRLEASVAPGR